MSWIMFNSELLHAESGARFWVEDYADCEVSHRAAAIYYENNKEYCSWEDFNSIDDARKRILQLFRQLSNSIENLRENKEYATAEKNF